MIYAVIILSVILIILLLKIIVMKISLKEINKQLEEILRSDTNSLICLSSSDRDIRRFANNLNKELKSLRKNKITLQNENSKLNNAVSAVSHDLRTPLTAMLGYIDLLETEQNSETAQKYIFMIRNRANALKKLTEELFKYSVIFLKEHKFKKENISLNAVLEESIAAFYGIIKQSGINPEISLPEENIVKNLDKDAVMRIFSNIISNALRYGGGDLNITLDKNAKIIFSNSAPNLDKVTAKKLFDKFYTVENARGSTGIGLTVAKELAEQMGGKIYLDFDGKKLDVIVDFST